jgi:hypothetical protein
MPHSFAFDGSVPEEVLASYLSHAVTHCGIGFCNKQKTVSFEDDMRMLKKMGAKFIGSAAFVWTSGFADDGFFYYMCKKMAARAHAVDPEFLLQACVFEAIHKDSVDLVPVPAYVFDAFSLPVRERCFRYDDMVFTDGRYLNHWGQDCSVPDITRMETRLWFFYRASSFIRAGYEGIHFGQVGLIGRNDPDLHYWKELIGMTRAYAAIHARRHAILIDAHLVGPFRYVEGLFDFTSFPIRLKELVDRPRECICEEDYLDNMFNKKDGFYRPFLVEFDNFGLAEKPGEPTLTGHHAWGYDEITWFALQPQKYRHAFLRYIADWVNSRYPGGWVQFPSRRITKLSVSFVWKNPATAWLRDAQSWENCGYTFLSGDLARIDRRYYSANNPSDSCPFGYGDEDVIAELIHAQD